VKVESARTVHSQAIADVHVGSWRAAYAHMFPKPFLDAMDVEDCAREWRDFIASAEGARAIFVASVDEAIVGFAAVGPYRPHDGSIADAHVGEVYAIYVDPTSWSAGVGRSLLDVAVAHLIGVGLTDIRLWMFADNHRARRFYERAGFAADGTSITETIGGGPNATEAVEQRFHLEAHSM
jgi:GNAT superfamily N-acetyltransferase